MLDREGDQHQHGANEEGGVEARRRPVPMLCENRVQLRMAGVSAATPSADSSADIASCAVLPALAVSHSATRGLSAAMALAFALTQSSTCGRVGRRDRRERVEDVGGSDGAAERQHGRPGKPVAPHRQRRDQLRVAHPGGRAIDRRAARFVRKEAGDLGVGEGLNEAHDHGDDPDQESDLSGCAGDAADGEQHEGWNAARNPECPSPIDGSKQFAFCWSLNICCYGHFARSQPFLLRRHSLLGPSVIQR